MSNAPSPAARPTEPPRTTLFEVAPAQGKDLHTTFDSALQRRAERAVAAVAGPAAVVALRPSDGAIRAAAVSPGPDPEATFGHFAPGATFRIVTALALLRAGRPVNSLADSPSAADISTEELRRAAASLGLGVDYEAGFSSFFGEIGDGVAGGAQVSPMAMAAVVGSIAAGRTVLPRLIEGYDPPEPTVPLTAAEAEALRALLPDKEFGSSTWYLGYSGDLAVAVWVREGDSAAAREALHALLH